MSNGLVVSPRNSINKTRNAILRMKNCSPELRSVLRQRCQERIQNERSKIISKLRKIKIQDSFRAAFGNILREEWENIEDDDLCELSPEKPQICTAAAAAAAATTTTQSFKDHSLDDELLWEELLEKELLHEHEEWLLEQYEELFSEDLENVNNVVCPLCCSGYLEESQMRSPGRIQCNKCSNTFIIEKSLYELQAAIYECLSWHDKQCGHTPGFVSIPKTESDNNLCIICDQCSFLSIVT